jgi:hypothetical protein
MILLRFWKLLEILYARQNGIDHFIIQMFCFYQLLIEERLIVAFLHNANVRNVYVR